MPSVEVGTDLSFLPRDSYNVIGIVIETVAVDMLNTFTSPLLISGKSWLNEYGRVIFTKGKIIKALYKINGLYFWIKLTKIPNLFINDAVKTISPYDRPAA